MTKKKMRRLIIAGVLIFFVAASLINFTNARAEQDQKFRSDAGVLMDSTDLISYDDNFDYTNGYLYENYPEYFKMLYLHCLSSRKQSAQYVYSMAIADREGNLTFASDNFVVIRNRDRKNIHMYVDFEPYLTDELRKEMRRYLRKEDNKYMQQIQELSVYSDGEKYIPVKMKIQLHGDEEIREFTFTDYEPTEVILRENTVYFLACFNELNCPLYNRYYLDSTKEDIRKLYDLNKDNFQFVYGGGASQSLGRYDLMQGVEVGDGYEIMVSCAYNTFIMTLLSDNFQYMTLYLAFLFAVAGIIFYILCMKVITKSEKLDKARSTFISAASHELKTPLAVIQNQCECIMENIAPEKNSEYVSSIYDEALRMNSIVTSLLSYNRISQLTAIEKEKCNLSELLREEVKSYRKFAESSGVIIEESITDNIYIDCNVQLMKMAIDNYLSNAVKYSVADKKVEVNLFKNKNGFTLAVINSADKSSVDIVSGAWDEFSRADKARQRDGTSVGMGLPICKKIFELHSFSGYCKYNDGKVSFVITG